MDNIFEESDDKSLSSYLVKAELSDKDIISNIQTILNIIFSNTIKQKIEYFSNRLNFSCPYCLDSNNTRKKRGNLYLNNKFYKCFNCEKSIPLYKFFEDYNNIIDITDSEILFLRTENFKLNSTKNFSFDILDKELLNKYLIDRESIKKHYDFISASNSDIATSYLRKRRILNYKSFDYNKKHNSIIIYNMNENDKVVGMVSRTLNENYSNKYLTYKLSTIYDNMEIPYEDDIYELDNISSIFNLLHINLNDIITIFEGPIDSFFYKNSIAISGIGKNMPFNIEYIQYWFDNDLTGIKKSQELLKNGNKVFLWKKYLQDVNINKHIKDLNELVVFAEKNKIKLIDFDEYFSDNKLDLYFL